MNYKKMNKELSKNESQTFTDITGLDAISTVTGMQYAYSRPGEYSVYRIASGNASVIEGLDLSENTKENMREAVEVGHTVVTPDRFVEEGVFRGVLYIVLSDNGNARYAIGEQVGNGGGEYE